MNKRKIPKWTLLFVIILLTYFSYVLIGQQRLLNSKSREMKQVQSMLEQEKKLQEELKKQKDMVASDEYIEKVAREKLDMVKRGEKVFVDVNK